MKFKCPICFMLYSVNDGVVHCSPFSSKGDSEKVHGTCIDCIKELAKAATTEAPVANGGVGLPCPVLECDNVLLINSFEKFLDSNIHIALSQRLQHEAIVAAEMDDLVTCPGCQMRFCVDRTEDFYDCSCGRRQCRNCPRIYDDRHKEIPCSKLDEEDKRNKLEPKLSEIAVRVCHKCKLQFVKEEGCNKMTCRCGAKQCYICREPVEDYSHFCECGWKETSGKCPSCFKSCPLFGDATERDRIQMEEVMAAFNATGKSAQSTNLFVKNFGEELDNEQLFNLFETYGTIVSHAIMRYSNGHSKGFGFVAFSNSNDAEAAIENLNGYVLPISKRKLYVAVAQKKSERQTQIGQSVNLYINNLNDSVTDDRLLKYFESFGEIISAKVMYDNFGQSKGFGFVCFSNSEAAEYVIKNFNDRQLPISKNKIYIGKAQKKSERQAQLAEEAENRENSNLYIKNLDKSIDNAELRRTFEKFGKITNSRVMYNECGLSKGFGFVCYENPNDAARAIRDMNNKVIHSKQICVAFYRKKKDKIWQTSNHNFMNMFRPLDIPGPSRILRPSMALSPFSMDLSLPPNFRYPTSARADRIPEIRPNLFSYPPQFDFRFP